ncbi:cytochrome P450 [Rhodococcus sp. UFZ-B548]|uniref:cytochrome P450 n=1 Tax=Rhodococcus sp. UFZ-B548 TaxID=2742212 RepID=UPI0015F658FA|nr:cytochrome P450 [Rhodococcus sp. UFZ-B548]
MTTGTTENSLIPNSDIDIFTDEALANPYPLYRELRDIAPLVYLPKYEMYALTRYEQVRGALDDWETFSSAKGVGLNPAINGAMAGTIINSDPPEHTQLRNVLKERLAPRALAALRPEIQAKADKHIEGLLARGEFDAVADLARTFPISIVLTMLGFPEEGRDQLLHWGTASFDAMGPANARSEKALPIAGEMFNWLAEVCTADRMLPGGLATTIHEAAARGDIPQEAVVPLMAGYSIPALDTTISAIGSAVWLLAQNPDQWDLVRSDRSLIPNVFNEVLRIESPAQMFARVTTKPYAVDGLELPPGSRVLLLFASANRDERKYPNPDSFDVKRDASDHVAFGYGMHGCPGQGLAKLEGHAVLDALARNVKRFELHGETERDLNNMTRTLSALPVTIS